MPKNNNAAPKNSTHRRNGAMIELQRQHPDAEVWECTRIFRPNPVDLASRAALVESLS